MPADFFSVLIQYWKNWSLYKVWERMQLVSHHRGSAILLFPGYFTFYYTTFKYSLPNTSPLQPPTERIKHQGGQLGPGGGGEVGGIIRHCSTISPANKLFCTLMRLSTRSELIIDKLMFYRKLLIKDCRGGASILSLSRCNWYMHIFHKAECWAGMTTSVPHKLKPGGSTWHGLLVWKWKAKVSLKPYIQVICEISFLHFVVCGLVNHETNV